jgi:hypothetical protein
MLLHKSLTIAYRLKKLHRAVASRRGPGLPFRKFRDKDESGCRGSGNGDA